jgi:hypothetical protein
LIPWTSNTNIIPGEFNTLTVLAQESEFTFCINGWLVNAITDNKRTEGYVGVFLGTEHVGNDAEFRFDNFTLKTSP